MIRVNFVEPKSDDWIKWKTQATIKRDALCRLAKLGQEFKISEFYKNMKSVFFEACFHKCAYCESAFKAQQPGDVEHFRPKRKVHGDNAHPGYYWLAYDWKNLLPSCSLCNGQGQKGNKFPIKGTRAAKLGDDLAAEKALLINPISYLSAADDTDAGAFDPGKHFEFDSKTGYLAGISEEGRKCIEIFGLNRDGLLDGRREAYVSYVKNFNNAVLVRAELKKKEYWAAAEDLEADLARETNGTKSYTLATRKALQDMKMELTEFLKQLSK